MTPPHPVASATAPTAHATGLEAELLRRFPASCVWYGRTTRHYWALVADRSGRYALVEAEDLAHLVRRLHRLSGWRLVPAPGVSRSASPRPDDDAKLRARVWRDAGGWTVSGPVTAEAPQC